MYLQSINNHLSKGIHKHYLWIDKWRLSGEGRESPALPPFPYVQYIILDLKATIIGG